MGAGAAGADVVRGLGGPPRPPLEPGVHVLEVRLLEPPTRLLVAREVPRADPAVEIRREWLLRTGRVGCLVKAPDVAEAAVLRLEPATGLQRRVDPLKQSRVVRHPVED